MKSKPTTAVILDTDIGSDIDDALCLAYLLGHPRCDLVGITTVSGEPEQRARLADAICRTVNRTDIPIHSGASVPLLGQQKQPRAQQAEILSNWDHKTDFPSNTAVDFLRETLRKRPGEITLLTIGPLTNIGLLFRLDPEIPHLLKSVVMMAGAFQMGCLAEWNVLVDPYAAFIVYEQIQTIPNLSVGLDVTMKCQMPATDFAKRCHGGALDVVHQASQVWFRHSSLVTFHDPLAAVAVFKPDVMQWLDGRVSIELKSDHMAGATIWDSRSEQQVHRVANQVDSELFFTDFFQAVSS